MANTEKQGAPVEGEGAGTDADEPTDQRKADSNFDDDFDDLIIEVDDSEVESELNRPSPSKKY